MHRLKQTGISLLVLIGMLATSGVALADSHEEPEEGSLEQVADTLFGFGYDLINRVFLWNISEASEEACTLDEEGLYEEDEEGNFASGDCELAGGDVTGPAGQVNHGMFLKLFNQMFDGPGWMRGCLVSQIAQSDLGKGEQQVKPGDEPVEPPSEEADATADFTTAELDCVPGPFEPGEDEEVNASDHAEGKPEWAGHGKPPWAGQGKPPWAGGPGGPGGDE